MRLVIDFGDIAHRLRRCWHWLTRPIPVTDRCVGCNTRLSDEEIEYYICNCERCEGYWMQKLAEGERL